MNRKRFLASLMVLTMSMGALVGCSSKEEPTAGKVESAGSSQTAESSKEPVILTLTTWGDEINEVNVLVEELKIFEVIKMK